jgi:hypothetical protein
VRDQVDNLLNPGGKSLDNYLHSHMTALNSGLGHGKAGYHCPQKACDLIRAEDGASEKAQDDIRTGKAHHPHQTPSRHPVEYPR